MEIWNWGNLYLYSKEKQPENKLSYLAKTLEAANGLRPKRGWLNLVGVIRFLTTYWPNTQQFPVSSRRVASLEWRDKSAPIEQQMADSWRHNVLSARPNCLWFADEIWENTKLGKNENTRPLIKWDLSKPIIPSHSKRGLNFYHLTLKKVINVSLIVIHLFPSISSFIFSKQRR